jgi:cytochrome c-type biogenesis protein CcmH
MKRLLAALVALAAVPAFAVLPDEQLDDPALESRAREISQGLRCVVCQNQSIDDSDAPLARDLRIIVRERLVAGDSDEQAVDYIVERYGNYVLLKPPFQLGTLALWLGPLAFLALGGAGVFFYLRGRRGAGAAPAPLSPAEAARLDRMLGDRTE